MFVVVFLGFNQYWPDVFMVLCPGVPKASVVLALKRLRRRDHGLKAHPTNWEKRIELGAPGYIHYTTAAYYRQR